MGLRVSTDFLAKVQVVVAHVRNERVECSDASGLADSHGLSPFLRRNKLCVFVAPRASARECFVVDADVSCVDVVFGPAASGDVAL